MGHRTNDKKLKKKQKFLYCPNYDSPRRVIVSGKVDRTISEYEDDDDDDDDNNNNNNNNIFMDKSFP